MTWYLRNLTLFLLAASLLAIAVACGGGEEEAAPPSLSDDTLDAILLVYELRQSSDDLTRMARLYVVTGEERYLTYFERILDIRDGIVPRPAQPNSAYWDIAVATGELPPTDGRRAALRDLLREAGLNERQLALVAQAERHSNDLAEIEEAAFAAPPADGRALLHGGAYHNLKADIMAPINELLASLLEALDDPRTDR